LVLTKTTGLPAFAPAPFASIDGGVNALTAAGGMGGTAHGPAIPSDWNQRPSPAK